MLDELAESGVSGELATIYAQIRELTALPYVSSLQRHLATRPGWLEWAWDAVGPLFQSGIAQSTAWHIANQLKVEHLPQLSDADCERLKLKPHDVYAIRSLAESFIRVSPTNLVFSSIVLRLINGDTPGARQPQTPPGFQLPERIESLPALVDIQMLSLDEKAVLLEFGTTINDQPFVPGLYRMLAHWPEYLKYLQPHITPLFTDSKTMQVCQGLAIAIDEAVELLFASVESSPTKRPADFDEQKASVRTAILRYRETSPQMVVFGTLIRDMLPNE